jgi:hypothetical protein
MSFRAFEQSLYIVMEQAVVTKVSHRSWRIRREAVMLHNLACCADKNGGRPGHGPEKRNNGPVSVPKTTQYKAVCLIGSKEPSQPAASWPDCSVTARVGSTLSSRCRLVCMKL